MKGKYFKNLTYMSIGTFFRFFLAIISTAIFIRVIGTKGYAIIGIVFSFYYIVARLDYTCFFALVKYNTKKEKDSTLYWNIFNTLHTSIILSGAVLFFILLPITHILSKYVYEDNGLMIFYFLGMSIIVVDRIIQFLNQFIRSNREEADIQKAYMSGLFLEFVLTLFFLLILDLGVISIFLGTLIAKFFEVILLYIIILKKGAKFYLFFSLRIFKKFFKEYAFKESISKLLKELMFWGGIFIATVYIDTFYLGILTFFASLTNKIREVFNPLMYHSIPLFSFLIEKKDITKIKSIISNINTLLFFVFSLSIIILIAFGELAFNIYTGPELQGTYFLFLFMYSGTFIWMISSINQYYEFTFNANTYNKMLLSVIIFYFIFLIPSLKYFGLFGIATTYLVFCTVLSLVFFLHTQLIIKTFNYKHIKLGIIMFLSLASLFYIHSGFVYFSSTTIAIIVLILSLLLFSTIKGVRKSLNYAVNEI